MRLWITFIDNVKQLFKGHIKALDLYGTDIPLLWTSDGWGPCTVFLPHSS